MTEQADRNGASEATAVLEAPSPEDSPKQVVFRSKATLLKLPKTAGYTDKSQGQANYIPTTGVQFVSNYLRLDDTEENKVIIDWLRKHKSIGISFIEVPDIQDLGALPPIADLQKMSTKELKELCGRRKVKLVDEGAQNDTIIIALLSNG